MELEICLCSLPKHCVSEDWTFSVRPEWHLSQSSLSRVVSPFPSVPKSSSKLCSSLGQNHRKTEIKQTPHICSRCSHYHDLLRMILLIWISTIGKTVQLSHLTQKIPWDLHTSSLPCKWEVLALHTSSLPCKWEVLAHTHESRGQQWLVAIDLYSVPSRLQCFHTYSLKRTRHLEDWRN